MEQKKMEQNIEKSTMAKATDLMLTAMEKLIKNEISADVAKAIALNGKTIVESAREASNFAKTTGMLPVDSAFGRQLQPLEPQVTREALEAQRVRLNDGEKKILPPARQTKKRDAWDNKGEFL